MIIQQVHLNNSDLYITGISPINEWEGTIVYRLYKDGNITKHVEQYKKTLGMIIVLPLRLDLCPLIIFTTLYIIM